MIASFLGAHLAEVSLFLNMTNILAAFNISKEVDKDGREIEPDVEWIGGAPEACVIFCGPF